MSVLKRWPALLALPGVLLLVVLLLLWLLLRNAPPLQLDVGMPDDTRFLSGFHLAETGDQHTFRWSGTDARMVLHGASSGYQQLRLLLHAEPEQPKVVELRHGADATSLARFELLSGWREYHILMPPASLATPIGQALPLDLHANFHRPGRSDDNLDLRLLGVPLAALELTPMPAPHHGAALPRALALGWLLALLVAGSVWLMVLFKANPSNSALAYFPSALMLLGGSPLLFWAWYDPYGLMWALPPLPWMLGTVTLLLLLAWLGVARRRGVHGQTENGFIAAKERTGTHKNNDAFAPLPQHGRGVGGEGCLGQAEYPSLTYGATSPWLASPWPLLLGLGLLALAGAMLASQLPLAVGVGIALALGALLLLTAGPHGVGSQLWAAPGPDMERQRALLLLGLIFLLALALRLFRLDEMPFGLWRDEARHGLFAQRIRDFSGYRPIYIASERVNMPAFGLYPFALALQLWGERLWSMRIITALAGALTVFPLYALATLLTKCRSVGLLAALLLAASSWHITVSRLAFPTVFDPLLTLSGLALLFMALRANPMPLVARIPIGFVGGALLGLAVQTYHTGRVAPLVAGWLGLLLLCYHAQAWRSWLLGGLAALLGLLFTLGPMLNYALNEPDAFNDRVGAVFLLSPDVLRAQAPLVALDDALRRHLLMFHVLGDNNGRHHAPHSPMLDYISGMGLLLGLAALLRWWHDWRTLFVFGGLALGLLPSALAMDAPHGLRAFAAISFAYLIVALGWVALWHSLWARCTHFRPALVKAAATLLLSLSVFLNLNLYFVLMPPQVGVYLVFYPVQSQMGVYMRDLADQDRLPPQIFVGDGLPQDPVFAFLTTGIPVETFAGSQLSTPAEPGAIFIISGYFLHDDLAKLTSILGSNPEPVQLGPLFPDGSRRTFYVYRVP